MRTRFHQGLDELKEKLLTMGGMAEAAVQNAVQAYVQRDLKRAEAVFRAEAAINELERVIDELAIDLLAMQQPMAVDLRFITAVMKINADLERVGDQAVNIAERAQDVANASPVDLPVDIPRMAETATSMVHQALQAFIAGDVNIADRILRSDDAVDGMNKAAFQSLLKIMESSGENARQALDALLVSRNLERIADHATNIAEDVIFWVRGADVRHSGGSWRADSPA